MWSVALMGTKQCVFDTVNYPESTNVLSFKLSVKEQCILFIMGGFSVLSRLRLIPIQMHSGMALMTELLAIGPRNEIKLQFYLLVYIFDHKA